MPESKLPAVGETIFTTISALSNKYTAINLGQGFPDFEMNNGLIKCVYDAMKDGHNQYANSGGSLKLRAAISKKILNLYGSIVDPNHEICITPGATYAIYTAITSIIHPGDEVIIFEPAYDSYVPNVKVNGGVPVLISLEGPDFKIDWDKVKSKVSARTRLIIINSPHNPTGTILEGADLLALQAIVKDTNILVVSDEVYEHITFDNKKHQSVLSFPDLFSRSFAIYSFGKVYNCTGWKVGYCVAPAKLMREFLKIHQFNAFSTNSFVQEGLANFLEDSAQYLSLSVILQEKRDFFSKLLSESQLKPLPSLGTYFQLYDYSAISAKKEIDFAKQLITDAGVAAIPVSAFYQEGKNQSLLRFCFVKKESTLVKAAERILAFERTCAVL
ncbi:MAG: aminotransferase class I/II-fold pyridoxal phosphate-dependent enzyme [Bacteroidetes bacterium]|nr:aminotransferase class I/II-fold pyridoxal phosphate-dependent enzyme [Bacteroidota bacterium]